MRRLDGQTKQHELPLTGRIETLLAERDYGFLRSDGGDDVYFHRNSVSDGSFARLKVGDRVRYVPATEEGEKGLQASAVFPLGATK